jgi:hypothetical protein
MRLKITKIFGMKIVDKTATWFAVDLKEVSSVPDHRLR